VTQIPQGAFSPSSSGYIDGQRIASSIHIRVTYHSAKSFAGQRRERDGKYGFFNSFQKLCKDVMTVTFNEKKADGKIIRVNDSVEISQAASSAIGL
jgi:hypothetical protein